MARDIRGIGFRTAGQVAAKLGIEKTALIRVRWGRCTARGPEHPALAVCDDPAA